MIKKFLFFIFILISNISISQINEAGIFLGGSNYIGDIGPTTYIYPNDYAVGIIYKYNLNPRVALRGTFTYSKISSDDADSKNTARQLRNLRFTNTIKEVALGVEFSYFEYDLSTQDKIRTPYILFEISAYNYNIVSAETASNQYDYKSKTSFSIPFGLGYKTKLFGPVAMAIEIGVRYTFDDDLDYNNQNIPALSFGNPNSNDWYVFSGINIVYTFGRPPCYATRPN